MRTITRYLIREMMGPFVFGVMAFAGLLVGFTLVNLAQRPELSGATVLKVSALTIPENLALAFPMGILLGTLFTLGRLSGNCEIIAMKAGGLSGARLLAPFLGFGIIASFASLYISESLVPAARRASSQEMARALGQQTTDILRRQNLPPEYDRDGRPKRLIYVGEFDLKQLRLRDVFIQEFAEGRLRATIQAEAMAWDGRSWQFQRGQVLFYEPGGRISRLTVNGGKAEYQPLLPKPREMAIAAANPQAMNWRDFRAWIAARAKAGEDVRRYLVELHTRLAIPFACLALSMVGAPLGVQTRRVGTAISFGMALLILFVYFFILSLGQVLGRTGILPAPAASWTANAVLGAVGVGLFIKRMR